MTCAALVDLAFRTTGKPPVSVPASIPAGAVHVHPIPFPPPGFDELSTHEKIDYLSLRWDRITTRSATIDVPDGYREVIAERLRDVDLDPNSGDQCDAGQKRLRERLGTKH